MSYVTNSYLGMRNLESWNERQHTIEGSSKLHKNNCGRRFNVQFIIGEVKNIARGSAVVLNTFHDFEHSSLDALSAMYPHVYSTSPLQLMLNQIHDESLTSISSDLWREEPGCIEWLNDKDLKSAVYVNFGSITVISD